MSSKNMQKCTDFAYAGALLTVLLAIFAGCAKTEKTTYPANMIVVEDQAIESMMLGLSASMWSILDILDSNEYIPEYSREKIISLLKDMENAALKLGAGNRKTNHLVLDDNIAQFRADVVASRIAIEKEPPNYFRVGRLTGSCLACHVHR